MRPNYSLQVIRIGHDDAEADDALPHYFIATPTYRRALSKDNILILGERGSGKTAIKRQIEKELAGRDDTIVASISPSDVAWSKLLSGARAAEPGIKRLIWEFVISCELFYQGRISGHLKRTNRLKWLEDVLKSVYGHGALPRSRQDHETMLSRLMDFSSRVLSGATFSYQVGPTRMELSLENLFPNDPQAGDPVAIVAKLRQTLMDYLKDGVHAVVLIDHLDDYWSEKTVDNEREMISALLDAVYQMSKSYSGVDLNIGVFLRTDLFEDLRFVNKTFLLRQTIEIKWDKALLESIVCERFRYCLKAKGSNQQIWKRVFNVPQGRPSEAAFGYFYNRSFCRPRDLIHFVGLALGEAQHEEVRKVEERHIRAVEPRYSSFLLSYFTESLAVSYPFLPELLSEFEYKSASFSRTTFERDRIASFKRTSRHKVRHSAKWLLQLLYQWGFLGAVPKGRKEPIFHFDPNPRKSTRVEEASRLVVHPGLLTALSIR